MMIMMTTSNNNRCCALQQIIRIVIMIHTLLFLLCMIVLPIDGYIPITTSSSSRCRHSIITTSSLSLSSSYLSMDDQWSIPTHTRIRRSYNQRSFGWCNFKKYPISSSLTSSSLTKRYYHYYHSTTSRYDDDENQKWKWNQWVTTATPRTSSKILSRFYSIRNNLSIQQSQEESNNDSNHKLSWIQLAIHKFRSRPGTYMLIPVIAALVGWLTNWLAVQMIFYPIEYRGLNIYRPNLELPLGIIGWQGIIPCKTRIMTTTLIDMVTTQLISITELFQRLDTKHITTILSPKIVPFTKNIIQNELFTTTTTLPQQSIPILSSIISVPTSIVHWIVSRPSRMIDAMIVNINQQLIEQITNEIKNNANSVFDIYHCVIQQMIQQKSKLGQLFQQCGQEELNFLTNSGLWFGFLLGIIQMCIALIYDNPWSLSIGGGIVGLATNWLALKWIFEPIDPIRIGPLILQGKFLRRQNEVAKTFANYFATNILTSQQIWNTILTDPKSVFVLSNIIQEQIQTIIHKCTFGLWKQPLSPLTLQRITDRMIQVELPKSVPIIFPYMDQVLDLERTLRIRMEGMTSRQFERVLHPIFEEDELTLIIAGAVLGFAAGLVQQGLEMNIIKLPNIQLIYIRIRTFLCIRMKQCRTIIQSIFRIKNQKSSTNDDNTIDDT